MTNCGPRPNVLEIAMGSQKSVLDRYKDIVAEEAWGSCSPPYLDVHVVVVGVGLDVSVVVGFTISHTAVTCWVCSPSQVLQFNCRVQQKLGVVALPYTSMFTLSNTAVTCWVCFPSNSTYE